MRPIAAAEALQRIAGKVVFMHARDDIIASVGSLQVCAGHEAGCQSLIHAKRTVYKEQSAEAILLVNASNAFNSVNKNAFLHNAEIISPLIAQQVKYFYSLSSHLFITGGGEIQLKEGTTQGNPAAVAIYAVAIVSMILMSVEIS